MAGSGLAGSHSPLLTKAINRPKPVARAVPLRHDIDVRVGLEPDGVARTIVVPSR
jgi:hypothetical protein